MSSSQTDFDYDKALTAYIQFHRSPIETTYQQFIDNKVDFTSFSLRLNSCSKQEFALLKQKHEALSKKSKETQPLTSNELMFLGLMEERSGNHAETLKYFKTAYTIFRNYDAYYRIGTLHLDGRVTSAKPAEKYFEELEKIGHSSGTAALACLRKEDKLIDSAAKLNHPVALTLLGNTHKAKNNVAAARHVYMLAIYQGYPSALYEMYKIALSENKTEIAISFLKHFILTGYYITDALNELIQLYSNRSKYSASLNQTLVVAMSQIIASMPNRQSLSIQFPKALVDDVFKEYAAIPKATKGQQVKANDIPPATLSTHALATKGLVASAPAASTAASSSSSSAAATAASQLTVNTQLSSTPSSQSTPLTHSLLFSATPTFPAGNPNGTPTEPPKTYDQLCEEIEKLRKELHL